MLDPIGIDPDGRALVRATSGARVFVQPAVVAARSQAEIVDEYCKLNQWVPKGTVARRLAIQDWWDRVYGAEVATEAVQ